MSTQIIVDGGGSTVTVSGSVTVVSSGGRPLLGGGVPVGGTAGQSLVKASDDDYDTEWVTVSGGGGGGSGTVTSVALSLPAVFSLTGSPITTAGTFTATLATQTANRVFAGPTSGSAAAPTFRALVAADIPDLSAAYATAAALTATNATVAVNTAAVAGKQAAAAGLASLSGLTGVGYVKETATGVFALVSSVPWADVSSKPANITGIAAVVNGPGALRQDSNGFWGCSNFVKVVDSAVGGVSFGLSFNSSGEITFTLTMSDADAFKAAVGLAAVATSGSAADLSGTLPDARLANVVTAGGPTGSSSVVPVITYDAHGRLVTVTTATVTPAAIGAQPADGDLTALAALSGTNTIYYRSAANTWTAVTIGSGMTFSGGVLDSVSGGSGTVTSASVVSANGFAGTVATATTTPAITLTTTVTGLVKGDGTALSAAVAGTDYATPAGNVATATALATGRAINGVTFDGTAAITVAAAAGTLTGTTLNATVVTSSLTSVGTLTGGATGAGFTVALGTSTVTGTLPAANMPALSGAVTSSAGSTVTSQVVGPSVALADPTEGQVLTLNAAALTAGTINQLRRLRTTGGLTCNVTVKINGTAVTFASTPAASGTAADYTATAANTYAVDDVITVTFSSVSGTGSVLFSLKATR